MTSENMSATLGPEEFSEAVPFELAPVGRMTGSGVHVQFVDVEQDEAYQEMRFPASDHHMVNLGLSGEYAIREWGGLRRVGAFDEDSICCIPSGVPGRWDTPRGTASAIHVFVPDSLLRTTADEAGADPDAVELRPSIGHACQCTATAIKTLFEEVRTEPACSSLLQQSLDRYLAYELLRCPESSARPTRIRSARLTLRELRRVHAYMEERIGENVQVEDLAAVLRRSPYEFIRQFGRGAGLPPHRYLTHLRVERVAGALRQRERTPTPLSQIAMRYGFADQSHMTRWFKKIHGVTPAAYRREHLGTRHAVETE